MEIEKINKVKSITEIESHDSNDNSFSKILDEKLKRQESVSADTSQVNMNKPLIDSMVFYGIPVQVNMKKEINKSESVLSELENYFNIPSIAKVNNQLENSHKEDELNNKNTINKKML